MTKRIIISVTTDLATDQRVHKVAQTLCSIGYQPLVIGRIKKDSLSLPARDYKTMRMKLFFEKKIWFYAHFNIKLFFILLFRKADLLLANDLDTLLPNYLISKLKKIPLVYDTHEYYLGMPALQNRPLVRKVWQQIERFIFPKLKYIYTVNDSIAALYSKEYNKNIAVIRNVPYYLPEVDESNFDFSIPNNKFILIYQGAGINPERGGEELIQAMQYLEEDKYHLLIVGGGDIINELKKMDEKQGSKNIQFVNKVPFKQLRKITRKAHLGLSLDKPTNLNYLYSLPNKLFDYLHAHIPVLASRLPEIEKIITGFNVGTFIDTHHPAHIAEKIIYISNNQELYATWKENTLLAARELCWQNEEKKLIALYAKLNSLS